MYMPSITLDSNAVKSAVCPAGKGRLDLYDTAISGFILEVRPSGVKTYFLRYRDKHGKQKQHKIGDTKSITFEQAKNAAQTLRARVVLGENLFAEKMSLKNIPTLEQFNQNHYMPFIKGYKRSWDTDDTMLRIHLLPRFGRLHLDEITTQDIIAFHHAMRAQGYAPSTCNRPLIILRYMFNLVKKWNIEGVAKNPVSGILLFEENNKRERFLNPLEVKRLYDILATSSNSQLKYIVPLLLLTGCRKRELLDAKWEHIDIERCTWRIPITKNGKARYVPLSTEVLNLLSQLPRFEACPYLVPNPHTKMPYASIDYAWGNARRQAELAEVRMHDLRHSFASFLVNAGRSLYEVQKILGHSQLVTTQRYAHLSQATLLDATNAAASAAGLKY
jgi:integrase